MTCGLYNTEDDGNAGKRSIGDVFKRSIGGDVLNVNERQTRLAGEFFSIIYFHSLSLFITVLAATPRRLDVTIKQ